MDREKYVFVVLWAKYFLGKSSCLSKIPDGKQENPRITISVFLCTFKLNALLLKKFHLLLHRYTLSFTSAGPLAPPLKTTGTNGQGGWRAAAVR